MNLQAEEKFNQMVIRNRVSSNFSDNYRKQSMLDPTKAEQLKFYSLDDFTNSIWENFLGSQVQLSIVVDADGTETITNENVDKLGPI